LPIITIKDLSFSYAGATRQSLRNVSLEVEEGEFVIVTGPSGCGKTTLCRCLNGLVPNFYAGELTGEILVCGLDVRQHPTSELSRHVGLVFQNPENQLFSLTVERDVAFGPENLGLSREETRERVEWAMKVTGIENLRDRAPYELSGGQQQRVALASVLAMKPEVMVLDEPTSFLDPRSSLEILNVIAKLNEELRMTVILVEHRLDLATRHCDRIVVLDRGTVVLDGPPEKVYGAQAHLIGIGVPKVTLLFHLLKQDGLKIDKIPVTVEEAEGELRRLLAN
jgi:energy-coupling factor transporter ATP-binding protein EcfA2